MAQVKGVQELLILHEVILININLCLARSLQHGGPTTTSDREGLIHHRKNSL